METENKIGPRYRDWVVGPPENGFIFPAFSDRSSDIHSVMFYTKNTEEPHKELMEQVLGCPARATAAEQKNTFHTIIKKAINDEEKSDVIIGEIQESLSMRIEEQENLFDQQEEPIRLTKSTVQEILVENGLPEELTTKIGKSYEEIFEEAPPVMELLLDKKVLAENEKRKENKALVEKIMELEEIIEEKTKPSNDRSDVNENIDSDFDDEAGTNPDVILRVSEGKINQIKAQVIDGTKYIMIPIEEDENASVNGVADFQFTEN